MMSRFFIARGHGLARAAPSRWTMFAIWALIAFTMCSPNQAYAEASPVPATCAALQAKYPQFKGLTLVNAINPYTPGYESHDPKDPSKFIGFDIDLGETLGS